MFVQTLVLVAVLFVVDLALRRRMRTAVRYWLWALVLLKLLLPVIAPHAGERRLLAPARAGSRGDGLDHAPS